MPEDKARSTTSPATAWSTTCPSASSSSSAAAQWDKGKGCDTFGPIGPWLVTTDEIRTRRTWTCGCDVNGERKQNGNTRTMIFGVAKLVAYVAST